MCFRYSARKNEARIKAREREYVFGLVFCLPVQRLSRRFKIG